jgi:hypothetical protein
MVLEHHESQSYSNDIVVVKVAQMARYLLQRTAPSMSAFLNLKAGPRGLLSLPGPCHTPHPLERPK